MDKENNFDETDLIFDNYKSPIKAAAVAKTLASVQNNKKISSELQNVIQKNIDPVQSVINLRKLVITARNQIEKLQEENKKLRGQLESDPVIRCPSCLFLHKVKSNKYFPKYIKAYPGRFTLELEFKSKEELMAFMEASQLQEDENGIPVIQSVVVEKRDCLFDAGSKISKLVEAEKQRIREEVKTKEAEEVRPKEIVFPLSQVKRNEPVSSIKSPRKLRIQEERIKISMTAEKAKENGPFKEEKRPSSSNGKDRKRGTHRDSSKEPDRKRKASEEQRKDELNPKRERPSRRAEMRRKEDNFEKRWKPYEKEPHSYGNSRKRETYRPVKEKRSHSREERTSKSLRKYEEKEQSHREERDFRSQRHCERRVSKPKDQSPMVTSTSKDGSTPRAETESAEEINLSDYEVEECDSNTSKIQVESAEEGELPDSPVKDFSPRTSRFIDPPKNHPISIGKVEERRLSPTKPSGQLEEGEIDQIPEKVDRYALMLTKNSPRISDELPVKRNHSTKSQPQIEVISLEDAEVIDEGHCESVLPEGSESAEPKLDESMEEGDDFAEFGEVVENDSDILAEDFEPDSDDDFY